MTIDCSHLLLGDQVKAVCRQANLQHLVQDKLGRVEQQDKVKCLLEGRQIKVKKKLKTSILRGKQNHGFA